MHILKYRKDATVPVHFVQFLQYRGKYISRPVEELVKEAELLAENGVKELILIAQDLSYYGLDLYKKQALPELVTELLKIESLEWIRLHYLYPANFPDGTDSTDQR